MTDKNTEIYKEYVGMEIDTTIHVKTNVVEFFVTRVIGGLLYNYPRLDSSQMNTVFVPLQTAII